MVATCNQLSIPRANRKFAPKILIVGCQPTDVVGDCVRSVADRVGDAYQVERSDPTDISGGPAWGVLIEKTSSTTGVVQFLGPLAGIYTSLTVNAPVWVGLDGRLKDSNASIVPPPGLKAFVQQMGVAIASDVVLLSPMSPLTRVR